MFPDIPFQGVLASFFFSILVCLVALYMQHLSAYMFRGKNNCKVNAFFNTIDCLTHSAPSIPTFAEPHLGANAEEDFWITARANPCLEDGIFLERCEYWSRSRSLLIGLHFALHGFYWLARDRTRL